MHAVRTKHTGVTAVVLGALSLVSTASTASSARNERSPARVHFVVVDERGQGLDARVRVRAANVAERVRTGVWGDVTLRAEHGALDVTLEPGNYQVLVSRGPEWSIAAHEVSLSGGEALTRRILLEHEASLPGWLSADLHVHTKHSDDAAEHGGVGELALRAEGIDVAVLTDHNRISQFDGMPSVPGAELTSWTPEIGHFNAFPLRHLPSWRHTTPARLFAELHKDPETFVQINHPLLDDHISYFSLGKFDGIGLREPGFDFAADGLEVWNGYDIARPSAVHDLLKIWRGLTKRGHRLTATGGSDCHGRPGHVPGYPRTYVYADSAQDLARALKHGRAFVTNGPLLKLQVNGHLPGDTVTPDREGKVAVRLTVSASRSVDVDALELWVDEDLRLTLPLEKSSDLPLRFETEVRIQVDQAHAITAVVRGTESLTSLLDRRGVRPLAFTNPVYIRKHAPLSDRSR